MNSNNNYLSQIREVVLNLIRLGYGPNVHTITVY